MLHSKSPDKGCWFKAGQPFKYLGIQPYICYKISTDEVLTKLSDWSRYLYVKLFTYIHVYIKRNLECFTNPL